MKGWLRASAVPVSAVPVRRASGEALVWLCSAAPAVQSTQGRNCFARSTYRGRELLALTDPAAPGQSGVVATRIQRGPRDHQPLEVAYSRLSTNGPTFWVTRTPKSVSVGACGCFVDEMRCARSVTVAAGSAFCTD